VGVGRAEAEPQANAATGVYGLVHRLEQSLVTIRVIGSVLTLCGDNLCHAGPTRPAVARPTSLALAVCQTTPLFLLAGLLEWAGVTHRRARIVARIACNLVFIWAYPLYIGGVAAARARFRCRADQSEYPSSPSRAQRGRAQRGADAGGR